MIVIGGGVQGISLALEAALAGLRPLLLERDDFGGATSFNHQRIVHGGFRYLQSADLMRYFRSMRERRWFMRHFPNLIRPLPCVLPLYGEGLRRPGVLWPALQINDILSLRRNLGVRSDIRLPRGRLMTRGEVLEAAPDLPDGGLQGGALWHDAVMTSSRRILMEMLRWATVAGASALNYVEAESLQVNGGGQVRAVAARDRVSGRRYTFEASTVVNCAGPWSRQLAARFDRDLPALFEPILGFLVYLRTPPPSQTALAVPAAGETDTTYFLFPWQDGLLAGTEYVAWSDSAMPPEPSSEMVSRFVNNLAAALPGWPVSLADVRRVHAGLVPAKGADSLETRDRDVIHSHETEGGPIGLYSVSGIKFTTARRVAHELLRQLGIRPSTLRSAGRAQPDPLPNLDFGQFRRLADRDPTAARQRLERIIREEAVVYRDDLLLRRVDWVEDPDRRPEAETLVGHLLGREAWLS